MTAKELSRLLSQRSEEVCTLLLPNGARKGSEWRVGSIHGEAGDSLRVVLVGEKAGLYKDFASGDKGGDLIDLWAAVHNVSISDAMRQACEYLKIPPSQTKAHKKYRRPELDSMDPGWVDIDPAIVYLQNERKITWVTLNEYGVRIRSDEFTGKKRIMAFPYYRDGELISIKYQSIDRKKDGGKDIWREKDTEPCLFGWQAIPQDARTVIICEGEIDALSWFDYGYPALSVPNGAGEGSKNEWVENDWEHLERFDEIFISMDMDSVGSSAIPGIVDRLGRHRCRVVSLPQKDCNECLKGDVDRSEIDYRVANAASLDPEELVRASDIENELIDAFFPPEGKPLGVNLPWRQLDERVRIRPNELSLWGGTNGSGKSQLVGQIAIDTMRQGGRVCIASMEMPRYKVLMRIARQALATEAPDHEEIYQLSKWYRDYLWIVDILGTAKRKRLLETMLYAHRRYDVDHVIIDSFLKCGIAEDDLNTQKAFVEELADFKNAHGVHIHLVAHTRKKEDEKQMPNKHDIRGSGAITDLVDNVFILWRNKPKEEQMRRLERGELDPKLNEARQKPDALLTCSKQRNGDWEGTAALWWETMCYQYLNCKDGSPIRYVETRGDYVPFD
jgi:twinkle protein